MRNFHRAGRSPVYAENGMVATSHPLASAGALAVLKEGGNAVDAAVTASAILAVVEPHMTGIGGDCFAIVAKSDGTMTGLSGSGRSAKDADLGWYLDRGFIDIPEQSAHAVTVPGAVRSWEALLAKCGTIGLDRALAPAINYARHGFHLAPRVASDLADLNTKINADATARAIYTNNGAPWHVGDRIVTTNLADTLSAIASHGADAFYTGPVAEEMAATIQTQGGLLSADDIAAFQPIFHNPVATEFEGHSICELPPNGQGIIALILLNILKEHGTAPEPGGLDRYHLEMEAAKLAYSVRDAVLSDPDTMTIAVESLISPAYAAKLAALIDSHNASAPKAPPVPDADTVYLSVVDRDGTACSFINSLFHGFGSGLMTPKSGVMLQSRACCFTLEAGHPNAIGSAKLPMHTIIPAMALKNGRPALSFGVMGGSYQACGQAHVLQNMLRYGMDPQTALDFPRSFWTETGLIQMEETVSADVVAGMNARGHRTHHMSGTTDKPIGGGQMIAIDHDRGLLIGGSDPRKDGCAIGF